jgi:hypothetical protein
MQQRNKTKKQRKIERIFYFCSWFFFQSQESNKNNDTYTIQHTQKNKIENCTKNREKTNEENYVDDDDDGDLYILSLNNIKIC